MKNIRNENRILIILAFFSISIGLWTNFRQLWLQDNNFSVTQISNIMSIGALLSIIGIALIGRYITLNKLKKYLLQSIMSGYIDYKIYQYVITILSKWNKSSRNN